MKYIVRFFVIVFFVFNFTYTLAEEKIVFINMDYLLNESKVGKSAQTQLEKLHKSNLDHLMKIEDRLKNEEKDILSKKNVLKQEEFEAKIDKLRENAKEYQNTPGFHMESRKSGKNATAEPSKSTGFHMKNRLSRFAASNTDFNYRLLL